MPTRAFDGNLQGTERKQDHDGYLAPEGHLRPPENEARQHRARHVGGDGDGRRRIRQADHGVHGRARCLALRHQGRVPVGLDGPAQQQDPDEGGEEVADDDGQQHDDAYSVQLVGARDAEERHADGRLDQHQAADVDEHPDHQVLSRLDHHGRVEFGVDGPETVHRADASEDDIHDV